MIIYNKNESDFSRNGLGFLVDCISAKCTETLNGDYILEFTYPVNGKLSEYIIEDNIVKCDVGDSEQLFRIKRIIKDYSTMSVYAMHITYDLLNNFLLDTYPKNLVCSSFGSHLLANTNYTTNFTFYSDISKSASARYVRKNPIEAIMGSADNSMINLFGGDIERDNFTIKLLANRGANNGVKVLFGKNIEEIKITTDNTSIYTRIIPIGYDGLLLPEKYVDSPLINDYITPLITKVEFSDIKYDPEDENAYHTLDEAYTALRSAVNSLYSQGIDKPSVNIKIDWVELSKVEQYKQYQVLETIHLGDTITANILGLDYTTRITKTIYNVLSKQIEKFEIGSVNKTIANTLNIQTRAIESISPVSILKDAKNDATSLITSAMGGYVYKTNDELYIMDTDNPETAQKVWRWNINGLGYSSTGINGTYGIAMTMDGKIVADYIKTGKLDTNVIDGYNALKIGLKEAQDDITDIEGQLGDIADMTVSAETDKAIIPSGEDETPFENIIASHPIMIKVRPVNTDISYWFVSSDWTPSATEFLGHRTLTLENITTNEKFTLDIPSDLLYYDEDNYDEFVYDYENNKMYITVKVDRSADGTKTLVDDPYLLEYECTDISLTEGSYKVYLNGYTQGYLFVRLVNNNLYTKQFVMTTNYEAYKKNYIEPNIDFVKDTSSDGFLYSTLNANANEINLKGDKFSLEATNCSITKEGNLTCSNADIKGNIEATGGKIGKFLIDSGYLKCDVLDYRLWVQGARDFNLTTGDNGDTWVISSQSIENQTAYFYIKANGKAYFDDTITKKLIVQTTNSWLNIEDEATDMLKLGNSYYGRIGCTIDGQLVVNQELYAKSISTDENAFIYGNLYVTGEKNRIVETSKGLTKLNAYETTIPYFGDIGTNKTNANGECRIEIEDIFKETIELENYKVFIQELGEGNLWVEKHKEYFIVKGTPNLEFDWEIKAIQKGYKNTRLDILEKEMK